MVGIISMPLTKGSKVMGWIKMEYAAAVNTLAGQGFDRFVVDAIVSVDGKELRSGQQVELQSTPGTAQLAVRDGRGSERRFRFERRDVGNTTETVYVVSSPKVQTTPKHQSEL